MRTLLFHCAGHSFGRYGLLGIALLLLLVSTPACSSGVVTPASTPSPEQLDVTLTITDDPRQASAFISMALQHGSEEANFLEGAVTCNGVKLPWESEVKQYEGAVPHVLAGKSYHCSYNLITIDFLGRTHNDGERAAIDVLARESPTILTPHAGDKLQRARPLSVTYAATSSAGVAVAAYGPHDSIVSTPKLRMDTGTYDGIDVSSLNEGWGSVMLKREYAHIPTDSGFQSAQTTYDVLASIDVLWT